MKRYRGSIYPRRRIFLGCEGKSEHAYGTLLGRLARDRQDIHVHIDVVGLNPGAGDPLALVEPACREVARGEHGRVSGEGRPENAGFDAFVPLIDSGISGYFWSGQRFLSVVLYTCKGFDQDRAIAFTREHFAIESEIITHAF